jgi:peroxiredoxin
MIVTETRPPLTPGELAPDFVLPSGHGEETVSLAEYRGRSPVLLALLRGLY